MERVMEQSVEEKEEVKGTSREPGALAGVYEVLSQRAIDEAIRIGVEAGTAAAERRLEEGGTAPVAKPLDMSQVTVTLWGLENPVAADDEEEE